MKAKLKSIVVIGITIALAIMISLPTDAIIFKRLYRENKIVSKIVKEIREKINGAKSYYRRAFSKNVRVCKAKADIKKISFATHSLLSTLIAANGDNSTINITNITANPSTQVVGGYVNISCDVTTSEGNISVVKVNISGPEGFGNKTFNMSKTDGRYRYYYNTTYSIAGVYKYHIWANNTVGDYSESSEYNFFIREKETEYTNVQLTNNPNNDTHPSIAYLGNGRYIVAYEEENVTDIYGTLYYKDILFKISTDNGKNWSKPISLNLEGNQTYPEISVTPDGTLYCVFSPEDKILKYCEWKNVYNFDIYDLTVYQFIDTSVSNLTTFSIATQGNSKKIIAFAGDIYYDGKWYIDVPIYLYNDSNYPHPNYRNQWYAVWFDTIHTDFPDFISYSNPKVITDEESGISIVYEVTNKSSNKREIMCLFCPSGDGLDETAWNISFISGDGKNLSSPYITSKNQNIYVVAERESENNYDIVLYNTSDFGGNWTANNVSIDQSYSERHPTLYINATQLFCLYHINGDISLTVSYDGGINWDKPVTINDIGGSVLDEYRSSTIADDHLVVWTDKRNNNLDIYCGITGVKPQKPGKVDVYVEDLTLQPFSDNQQINNILTFTIGNKGNETANNVHVKISYQKTGVGYTPLYEKHIDSLAANETQNIKYVLFSCKLLDIIKSTFRIKSNGIMGKEGLKALKNISAFKVEISADKDNVTNNNEETLSVKFEDFGFPSITPDRRDIHFGETFNITVTKYGIPVNGALVIYGPLREEIIIPLILILSKINFRGLHLKLRYKIILRIVKNVILLFSPLALVDYALTDEIGRAELKTQSMITSLIKEGFPKLENLSRAQKTIHIFAIMLNQISEVSGLAYTNVKVTKS